MRYVLYTVYSAVFPHFVSEAARRRPEPHPASLRVRMQRLIEKFRDRYPRLGKVHAIIYLDYYLPIFHPIFWWRHTSAINALWQMVELQRIRELDEQ
jgi:hypothetical protein